MTASFANTLTELVSRRIPAVTGGEGGDGEEAGLIGVGWDDGAGMVGVSLERED